jgi:hypothetical protein
MAMNPADPGLEDVKSAIQEECARFNIRAIRADEIEHSEEITHHRCKESRGQLRRPQAWPSDFSPDVPILRPAPWDRAGTQNAKVPRLPK